MLTRNLLYTAITRAKERVILISTNGAIWKALESEERRRSLLMDLLVDARMENQSKQAKTLPNCWEYDKTAQGQVQRKREALQGLYPGKTLTITIHNEDGIPTVEIHKAPSSNFNIAGMYDIIQYMVTKADDLCKRTFSANLQRVRLTLRAENRIIDVPYSVIKKYCFTYRNYGHPAKWWVNEEFCQENGRRVGA